MYAFRSESLYRAYHLIYLWSYLFALFFVTGIIIIMQSIIACQKHVGK